MPVIGPHKKFSTIYIKNPENYDGLSLCPCKCGDFFLVPRSVAGFQTKHPNYRIAQPKEEDQPSREGPEKGARHIDRREVMWRLKHRGIGIGIMNFRQSFLDQGTRTIEAEVEEDP